MTIASPIGKRAALSVLPAARLRQLLDGLGVEAADRKSKEGLAGALEEHFLSALVQLKRDELKAICEALGLDPSGKVKDEIMERIVGSVAERTPSPVTSSAPPPATAKGGRRNGKRSSADGAQLELGLIAQPAQPRPVEKPERRTRPEPAKNGNGGDTAPDSAITQAKLESHLWEAANILRGSPVDRTDWKSYILPLLFFKRVCDVWDEEHAAMLAEYGADFPDEHRFQIPEGCHWRDVRATAKNVGTALQNAMRGIESENQKHLYGVFGDAQWSNKERLPDELLKNLIEHFSELPLGNDRVASDVMGNAYEYLIKQFADSTNKKAGEFYTPRSVVRLMVDMLDPKEGETIYDPACGTGGMLLAAVAHVRENGGDPRTFFGKLYAQEKNLTTASVARMNLFLHGIEDFQVERGDTLRNPVFMDPATNALATFDVVIANPPFSLEQWGREVWETDPWGRAFAGIPTDSSGDFAWVQHMVKSMAEKTGRMAVVLPQGALFRGGVEGEIRRKLLGMDVVEAVIGLAPNLFYGTGLAACVLVLRKKKPAARKGKVLIADASTLFRKGRAQNFLEDDHAREVLGWYQRFEEVQDRTRVVSLAEIEKEGFTLNISRYVLPPVGADIPPLPEAVAAFKEALARCREAEERLRTVMVEGGWLQ